MVTGASTADVAVVLLDARKGVIEQTRRHTFISATLGIPHIVFAVNKMDLVDFDEEPLPRDRGASSRASPSSSACRDAIAIPIAALPGRQRRRAVRAAAVVGRRDVPRAPRDDRDRRRPRRRASALPGAVGHPADVRRAPRLPRLRGPGRGRRVARRRRRRRPPLRPPHHRRGGRDARRPPRRRRPGAVGRRAARRRRRRLARGHALRPRRPARGRTRDSRRPSAG